MSEKKFTTGADAVAYGAKLARVGVISAYPITPSTHIVEQLATFIANGELDADFIKAEGEHSAMAGCFGACIAGVRTFTATASHGLAYMHEMLSWVAGGRFPVVMAVANRSVGAPWSIWGEHQDAILQRDTGWIQFYVETAQEALDTTIQAFKIAENHTVSTPVMVCLDGFNISHAEEIVEIPDQDKVDNFLPPFSRSVVLDPDNPLIIDVGAMGRLTGVWRFEQIQAMEAAKKVIEDVDKEFGKVFGRSYGGLVDTYKCEDAEVTVVGMGGLACGATRDAVDSMRNNGVRAGMLRLRSFRPFPNELVRQHLAKAKSVVVIDRDFSYGNEGAVYTEVKAALYGLQPCPSITNFIGGLAGADLVAQEVQDITQKALQTASTERTKLIFQYTE